jgi:hypothetical protein
MFCWLQNLDFGRGFLVGLAQVTERDWFRCTRMESSAKVNALGGESGFVNKVS